MSPEPNGREDIGQLEGMSIVERLPWIEGMTGLSEEEIRFSLFMSRPYTPEAQAFPLLDQSQGGPGIWKKVYEGTTDPDVSSYEREQAAFAYQKRVTGAPQDIAYVVLKPDGKTEVKFDGYDPKTGALLDAKNWNTWPPLDKPWGRDGIIKQLDSQVTATQGREIDWIVPSEEKREQILRLFTEENFDAEAYKVHIKVVP